MDKTDGAGPAATDTIGGPFSPERQSGSMSADASDPAHRSERPLRVVLDVRVGDACPLTDIDGSIAGIRAQQIDDICECEVVVDDDVVRLTRERGPDCVADIVHRHDCVPTITAVDGATVRIAVYPPDRDRIAALIADLRAAGYDVQTRQIRDLTGSDEEGKPGSLALIDRSRLTDKQRAAVEAALEAGYYDAEKGVTLDALAADLDISKSAVSRRLRAAEATVMRAAFGDADDGE
ncbi:helix-turn-helix domain-containing protein [Halococcoides cellulosivorans]|nr:helix-turn-helix domain-containing protein [Halococcoides cellulosivorans]